MAALAHEAIYANPSAISLFVACVQHKNLRVRSASLHTLERLYDAAESVRKMQGTIAAPSPQAGIKGLPFFALERMSAYGLERCEMSRNVSTMSNFVMSVYIAWNDRSFLRLGRDIGEYLLRADAFVSSSQS
jgi:hypothetical protein